MKVWITKYALTQGIYEADAEICSGTDFSGNMICIKNYSFPQYFHGKGKQWAETKEQAIVIADSIRKKKIESIYKQIYKLERLNFETM